MTSIIPVINATDMKHMYDFSDIKPEKPTKYCVNESSIMGVLLKGCYSKFVQIIITSKLNFLLDDIQANFTIFAAPDKFIQHIPNDFIHNMDVGTARQIILNSLIDRRINGDTIKFSPAGQYRTRFSNSKLYITTLRNKTIINNNTRVINFDIQANNGLIHNVDNLLIPINLSY